MERATPTLIDSWGQLWIYILNHVELQYDAYTGEPQGVCSNKQTSHSENPSVVWCSSISPPHIHCIGLDPRSVEAKCFSLIPNLQHGYWQATFAINSPTSLAKLCTPIVLGTLSGFKCVCEQCLKAEGTEGMGVPCTETGYSVVRTDILTQQPQVRHCMQVPKPAETLRILPGRRLCFFDH